MPDESSVRLASPGKSNRALKNTMTARLQKPDALLKIHQEKQAINNKQGKQTRKCFDQCAKTESFRMRVSGSMGRENIIFHLSTFVVEIRTHYKSKHVLNLLYRYSGKHCTRVQNYHPKKEYCCDKE